MEPAAEQAYAGALQAQSGTVIPGNRRAASADQTANNRDEALRHWGIQPGTREHTWAQSPLGASPIGAETSPSW